MTLKRTLWLIRSDLWRYRGHCSLGVVLRALVWGRGERFIIWLRLTRYFHGRHVWGLPFFQLFRLLHHHDSILLGYDIPWSVEIGPGFYLGHGGSVVINPRAVIGRNCNVAQGVTIGQSNRGKVGAPVVEDHVWIGPGAQVFGGIRIGHHVAIGANAVVNRSIKPYSIVIPAPVDVIACNPDDSSGLRGSDSFISRIDYE